MVLIISLAGKSEVFKNFESFLRRYSEGQILFQSEEKVIMKFGSTVRYFFIEKSEFFE